jgi:PAS domain S-box-containing protein
MSVPRAPKSLLPGSSRPGPEAPQRRRADLENNLFATIVEEAFSEILVFDAKTLTLLFANRSARGNLGYDAGEIAGLRLIDIKADYTEARLREAYRPMLEGETSRMVAHTIHRRKDGTLYPAEIHSRASTFDGRAVIFQIVLDQTEIKHRQLLAELGAMIERDAAETSGSDAFLAVLMARLGRQFRCCAGRAHLWNSQSNRLEPAGSWWDESSGAAADALPLPADGPAPLALRRGKTAIQRHAGGEIVTAFTIPLMIGDAAAAALEFFSRHDLAQELRPELLQALEDQIGRLYERKCHEERVNESRERFDAAVNGAAVGLWDYHYKNDEFYLSPRCREILAIPEGAPSPSWEAFGVRTHPKDVKRTAVAMKAHMLKRTPYDIEYRYRLSDGRYIWVHARARGVWDEAGNIIRTAGTIENISAEKEAEQVQREVLACIAASSDTATKISQALDKVCRYLGLDTALVSHVADGDFTVRYRSSGGGGPALGTRLPLADTICSDIYSGDVLQAFPDLAHSPLAEHPARAQSGIAAYIGTALFVRGVRFGTLSFVAPSARPPFSEAEISLVRLLARWIGEEIGRAFDVAELIENDARTASKLASAADALLTVDSKGRIEDANPAAAAMFGWKPEQSRGKALAELLPTLHAFSHPDGRLIPVRLRQDIAIGKDNRRFSVLLNITEIHVGGRSLFTVAISDITEAKKAEVAKGEFISIVSHELRTPLTSIRGALSLLASETTGALTAEAAKLTRIAQRNCERLLRLVNDILAIDKLEAGRFEMALQPVDLRALLTDAVAANALYAAKYEVRFRLVTEPELPPVVADPERLMQVMANLLSNAAKFTRPGTEVDVVARHAGRTAHISVRDRGSGIPEALRERIFDKFVQGENVNTRGHEGSGLGLSITRKMVALMNGEISFHSEAGNGTTFTVSLPVAEIDRKQIQETPHETRP